MLTHSNDPNVLKHTATSKDKSGDSTHFFRDCFKGEPSPEKINLNDSFKLLALRDKSALEFYFAYCWSFVGYF